MSIRKLPSAPEVRPSNNISCELLPAALNHWIPSIKAAKEDDNTISIFDPIGFDWWTGEGVTAKRISAALYSIGENPVTVNINSPGGDVFEGLAIYNLLREHKAKVTINILGLAASAASFIAMAGDEIRIAKAGFLMIHNGWVSMAGNRNELREIADFLEKIDSTLATIYSDRTAIKQDEIQQLMDDETWLNGEDSVEQGFADSYLATDLVDTETKAKTPYQIAARKIDSLLAEQGLSRNERRTLIKDLKQGMPSATNTGKPSAANNSTLSVENLNELKATAEKFLAASK